MKIDVREMLNKFNSGMKDLGETNPEVTGAFGNLLGATYTPNKLSTKEKELISIGISVHTRCEYCIVYHVYHALNAGADREEIMEASLVAVCMGGGPSMTYVVSLVKDSIDEFEKDFVKSESESAIKEEILSN